MVKPGDASMAAPFTARASSVQPCIDILRQGRCTLVTTVQMFKILGQLSLLGAYSYSVQYLQGVKMGDYQATVSGMFSAAMFFLLSQSRPVDALAPQLPQVRWGGGGRADTGAMLSANALCARSHPLTPGESLTPHRSCRTLSTPHNSHTLSTPHLPMTS